jgi:G6PDH family F420-dependent oxidoreductase
LKTVEIGYALTSELHSATEMVRHAQLAEQAGFSFALISDHFHPFFSRHGESPFVWSVIGAIAQATERLVLGSGVTCPLQRYHPALVAQAAATCATLMPGRFFLGVGTGAALNEHIYGDKWPAPGQRVAMLAEAIEIIRRLWRGDECSYAGQYYTVEQAQLFSRPDNPPPLVVAASGPRMARLAARLGDGLVGLAADRELVDTYLAAGASPKAPRYAQVTVCYAQTEAAAQHTAQDWWPLSLIPGSLIPDLATPAQFGALRPLLPEGAIARTVVCGPDPAQHCARLQEFADAGFTHLYLHQVGPDQEGFFRFYQEEVLPAFAAAS